MMVGIDISQFDEFLTEIIHQASVEAQNMAVRAMRQTGRWEVDVSNSQGYRLHQTFIDRNLFEQAMEQHRQGGLVVTNHTIRASPPTPSIDMDEISSAAMYTPDIVECYELREMPHPRAYMGGYGPRMMQHVVSTTEAVLDGPPDLDMDYFGSYTPIKRKANTKARELFMECLTESELEEFKNFSTVTIRTKIGLFRVEIQDDEFGHGDPPAYNVIHNDNRCCAILGSGGIPRYDHYLMQVLLIKSNPSRFVEEANARRIR